MPIHQLLVYTLRLVNWNSLLQNLRHSFVFERAESNKHLKQVKHRAGLAQAVKRLTAERDRLRVLLRVLKTHLAGGETVQCWSIKPSAYFLSSL